MPEILSVLSKRYDTQIKIDTINSKYDNEVNTILEEELNNRFKRGWLSYIGI